MKWGTRYSRSIAFSLAVVMQLAFPLSGAFAQTPPPSFLIYDNTNYPNSGSTFDAAGALRATVMYSQSTWPGTCNSTGCPDAPTESEFKNDLQAYVNEFGTSNTIIFDYEDLDISNESSTAAANYAVTLFQQMIAWTRQVYPNAKIGMYDYDWSSSYDPNSSSGYNAIRAKLFNGTTDSFDFFAPTMYQRWSNHEAWDQNLAQAIINDSAINQANGLKLPIYPYISPYTNGNSADALLADSEWEAELTDLFSCNNPSSSACQTVMLNVTPVSGECSAAGSTTQCSATKGAVLWVGGSSSDVSPSATWVQELEAMLSPQVIANGTYEIVSAGQGNTCADAGSGGGTVLLDACAQTSSQEWNVTPLGNGTFTINSYNYQQENPNTGNNQVWGDTNGSLVLSSLVSGGTATPGQEWQIVSLANGYYEFVELGDYATDGNTDSEECLTAGSNEQLTTAVCSGGINQEFEMLFVVGNGYMGLSDVADAFTRGGTYADDNFGTNSYLAVENSSSSYTRKSYFMFNLSSVSRAISRATIYLVPVTDVGININAAYIITNNSWTQTGITWNNAPAFSSTELASWGLSPSSVGLPILFDVTSAAISAQNSDGLLSIGIDAPNLSDYVAYGSQRSSTPSYRLMLVVSTE